MGSGRVRLVDVGARSMPGRIVLFRLRVEMPRPFVGRGADMTSVFVVLLLLMMLMMQTVN